MPKVPSTKIENERCPAQTSRMYDPYAAVAAEFFRCEPSSVTPKQRQTAKLRELSLAYGAEGNQEVQERVANPQH